MPAMRIEVTLEQVYSSDFHDINAVKSRRARKKIGNNLGGVALGGRQRMGTRGGFH